MIRFGASFSVPYAEYLGISPRECLKASLVDLGVRRLRLMTYWNRVEKKRGKYSFREIDWQIKMAEKHGAVVTLCLGLRQPRWPENHWPAWARNLPEDEWQTALLNFIEAVVRRYRGYDCVISWQLENEAFNRNFGLDGNFDRERLKREMELVKTLDPNRPVIMTASNSWGVPLLGPRADIYGFSVYRYVYRKEKYWLTRLTPGFFRLRALIVRLLQFRKAFIHELQAEPWGPKGIPDMSIKEQFKSMNPLRVQEAVRFAASAGLYPADLWGLEWWYWLKTRHRRPQIWDYMREVYQNNGVYA